jgi:hypothetical protein
MQNKAIEARAVAAAIEYFRARGWDVEDVGTRGSFDLRCRKDDKSLHVEVKGTTSHGRKVLLTRNEVHHARGTDSELALFVLSGIETTKGETPVASGGKERVLHPWIVDETSLDPIAYEYTLPQDSSER